MAEEQYLTFQKFNDPNSAQELSDLFSENGIICLIENSSTSFDPSFANNEANKEFRVKLKRIDFDKADKILLEISKSQIEGINKDHYLFGFTDQELIEIVTKPDEWNKLDYLLAQKILKERGLEINQTVADALRKQRIEELAKPEESQRTWIMFGYILAFIGGLLGIFIGWHLSTHKKTLPNGDRVYAYSESDRNSGLNILILGIMCFIIWIVFRIFSYKFQ